MNSGFVAMVVNTMPRIFTGIYVESIKLIVFYYSIYIFADAIPEKNP